MIIGYKVIDCRSLERLEELVEKYIGQGWQPFGSLCCILDEDKNHIFIQTMVKESEQ